VSVKPLVRFGLEVCPCLACQADAEKGRPMFIARWKLQSKSKKVWWAPFRRVFGERSSGFYENRKDASAFGPMHASRIGRACFEVTELKEDVR
jgi:hypothetical protein